MAAGVTDQLSEIGEIVATLVEDLEPERYRCDFKGKDSRCRINVTRKSHPRNPRQKGCTKARMNLYLISDHQMI